MQRASIFLIAVLSAQLVWAQSPKEKARIDYGPEKGYWVDDDTKLMWTVKDNGSDIDWNQADAYCRGMTLGGLTGWRLASIGELQRMFDPSITNGYKIKSPLQLSAWFVWSGTTDGSSWASYLYFHDGKGTPYPLDNSTNLRALCVRVSEPGKVSGAKRTEESKPQSSQAKEKGYWVDDATKLMWTVKDNGYDIGWNQADAYCRGMTLGGLTGWRLASIEELQRMFDPSVASEYKIKPPLQLSDSGRRLPVVWSGTKDGSSEAWGQDFLNGERHSRPLGHSYDDRALCVRVSEPGKVSRAKGTSESKRPQAKEKGYWVDGDTKLMWTVKDNGNDIDWNQAVAYCRGMTLGGLTGWRLASIEELQRMFDPSIASEYKIKSPLQLSSWGVWSGTKDGSSEAWIFYFGLGKRGSLHLDASYYTRALCVRVSKK